MRIAYVTAHLPPDFTSGATLLVERLASTAAALGHEVEVLSGAIAAGLADGETRTTTSGGVNVHWIGTTERVEQDDDANWTNPRAGAIAAAWFQEFRPEVIHIHTVQTLGVEVVEAALATGIRTVVTMHDLWWWCSRLFLVDNALRPCPLVTDLDTCACSRTRAWRTERAARLGRVLAGVHQVLAPSAVLRDVIIANGVDPNRVALDENDVAELVDPQEPDRPQEAGDRQLVRFLYIGGDSPLKGADVMREAVERLASDPGWELDAYGLTEIGSLPAACRLHPAFHPEQVGDVLATSDVLIIPSIARESFSIAAREALSTGLPVITSDCLGPEEVVSDRVNGLIVPTGDVPALVDAMRSLLVEPGLLDRLRSATRDVPVSIRSTGDHVESLVAIYTDSSPATPSTVPRSVAFVVGADGAIARYRVHHAAEALRLHGTVAVVAHYLDPALASITDDADVVVLQRAPATTSLLTSVRSWRAAGKLVVFDTDDLIFDPELIAEFPSLASRPDAEQALYIEGVRRYRTTLESCDGALVSTPAIARHVAATTGLPAAVVANRLGLVEMRLAETARRAGHSGSGRRGEAPVRVAYFSGSDSHQADLSMLTEPLSSVLDRHADVELLVVGPIEVDRDLRHFGARVKTRPFQPWRSLPGALRDVDINLAPLVLPSRFNEAKSAVKWLEASIMGVPTIASATGPFRQVVEHGRTGLLCTTSQEWSDGLEQLIGDRSMRVRVGTAARRQVELHHGPHITAIDYLRAFDDLTTRRDERRRAGTRMEAGDRFTDGVSEMVAPDERAPSAPALDSYDLGDDADVGRLRRWLRLRR